MEYILIQPKYTEDKSTPKNVVDAPSHLYEIINYIPTGGILETREGVTEFTFLVP